MLLASLLALRTAHSSLTYDEGSYLLSVLDLKGGQALGTDVFAPQPPLFYDFVRFASWVFGPDVAEVRRGIVVVFLAGVVGAYLFVRALVGRWAGLAAAAFVVVAPPIPLDASRVYADLPALAMIMLSLGLAAQRPTGRRAMQALAFSAGAVAMVAVGIKLTALLGVVPLVLLLARPHGRVPRLLAAALGALLVAAIVLIAYRNALDALWTSMVDYREAAHKTRNLVGGRQFVEVVLNPRAAFTAALALGIALAAVRVIRERTRTPIGAIVPVLLFALLGLLALATYRPLHLNHLVVASAVLAVFAATLIGWGAEGLPRTGRAVVFVLVVVLALGAFSQGWRRSGTESAPPDPGTVALAARLADLVPENALVVSDNPGLAYLARRRTPGQLVDTAHLRFETGSLTNAGILRILDRSCVARRRGGEAVSSRGPTCWRASGGALPTSSRIRPGSSTRAERPLARRATTRPHPRLPPMKPPKILAVASAVDLDFRYGCTPAWWQLWKGMYEAGVDLVVTPYRGRPVESPWWRTAPNPTYREAESYAAVRDGLARLKGDRYLRRAEDSPDESALDKLTRETIWRVVTPRWRKHLEKLIEHERPDAVVFFTVPMAHFRGIPTALRERFGIPVVFYDGDVPMSLPEFGGMDTGFNYYHGADPSEYDLVLSNSEGGLPRLLELGARRAEAVFWGADPEFFAPQRVTKEMDVFFYGYGDKFRREWTAAMVGEPSRAAPEIDFALGGRDFRGDTGAAREIGDVPFNVFARAISSARINLNVTRRSHATVTLSSTCRPFELASAGAAIVSNPHEGIEQWFDPGSEIVVVEDGAQALEAYRALLADPAEALAMGARARERVLGEHTYAHRARRVIDLLGLSSGVVT